MDDLISRQGTCDSLNKYRIEKMLEGKDVSLVWECIDKVLQEPSAQVERKTGRWVHLGGSDWCCSACGHVICTEGSWEHPLERGCRYCENCGAEMEASRDAG